MLQSLLDKSRAVAVVGLGYVGLPVALAFARRTRVVGFDTDAAKLETLRTGKDPNDEVPPADFAQVDIRYTRDIAELREAGFFIVTVPTPVDETRQPDLRWLVTATRTIAGVLKQGDFVVFESTTYPGCTEETCIPLLESVSGLREGVDFFVGYSPERINPGDRTHPFAQIPKIVSATSAAALDEIAAVYRLAVSAELHKAPSIKVAEAAKSLENTQRDLNIALMNEMSVLFDRMGIDTADVLAAAGTKWNFLPFTPGLVGGHCTGVDPYYLIHRARAMGTEARLISAGRSVNEGMTSFVAERVTTLIAALPRPWRFLVKGITFKENVRDLRNTQIRAVIRIWQEQGITVDWEDPLADPVQAATYYGLPPAGSTAIRYDAVVVAVPHRAYETLDDAYFCSISKPGALIADLKGLFRNKIIHRKYWTL